MLTLFIYCIFIDLNKVHDDSYFRFSYVGYLLLYGVFLELLTTKFTDISLRPFSFFIVFNQWFFV